MRSLSTDATKDNTVNIQGLTAVNDPSQGKYVGDLMIVAGKVEADNLQVDSHHDITLYGVQSLSLGYDKKSGGGYDAVDRAFTATADNSVTLKDSTLKTSYDYIGVKSGKVTLDNTTLELNGRQNRGDDTLDIFALASYNDVDDDTVPNEGRGGGVATPDNAITFKNSSALIASNAPRKGTEITLIGGSVNLGDASLSNPKGQTGIAAVKTFVNDGTKVTVTMQPKNLVSLENAIIANTGNPAHTDYQGLHIIGGTVDLGAAQITSDETQIAAVSSYNMKTETGTADADSFIYKGTAKVPANASYIGEVREGSAPAMRPDPTTPDPVPPTDPSEHINKGWKEMNDVLEKTTSTESIIEKVAKITRSADAQSTKNEIITGYILSIANTKLTDDKKANLIISIIDSFAPLTTAQKEGTQDTNSTRQHISSMMPATTVPSVEEIHALDDIATPVVTGANISK